MFTEDGVELVDASITIRAEHHVALAAAIADAYCGYGHDDLDQALATFDLLAIYDEKGDLVAVDHDPVDDSFAGDKMFGLLAPFVEAGDFLTWRQQWDGYTYRVLFDGAGNYRTLEGRLVFGEE